MLSARLAARMQELEATDEEIAILAAADAERVAAWREGEVEIDPDSAVRLRPLLSEGPAGQVALERIRHRSSRTLRGDGAEAAGIDLPYGGGHEGATGGQPE